MATIPTPRSWNQVVGDMVDAFLSRFGLKSLKVGGPVLSLIEASAQSDLRSSQDIFNLLNAQSLDRATGIALDRIGADEDVARETESPASGAVTITDTSFTKISSKIYQGQPAPIAGTQTLYVTDASAFPASGSVYLGRSTSNYEGPIAYSAKTSFGTYWTLTLSSGTTRYHNVGETVILAKGGNRTINAGTVVQTPQGNISDAVKFSTLFAATIPDGETQITGVKVIAQTPGSGSNIPAGAIDEFSTPPFTGASVTNPLPYTNGQATEDDKTYRERIKNARQSRAKGTALAIETAVKGIVATDENKRVTSTSVVTREGYPTTLYIDDGTGYEEVAEGVSVEPLIDVAFGGEQYFQVSAERPVAKASITTVNSAPFQLTSGMTLAVKVGGIVYEHTFTSGEFRAIGNATAYELATAINSDSTLGFSAATSGSGTQLRIFAKVDSGEDIEVVAPVNAVDANAALLLPTGRVDTMRLYKNDRLLTKDGSIAILSSKPPSAWGSLTSGVTLTLAVDGTSAVTYTFVDQDFINANTGFTTVGTNTLAAWAAVFNAKIPGITASVSNGLLTLASNLGASARAALSITGGTLVTPGQMFLVSSATGSDNDYTLDRNTGQIRLEQPLAAGDSLAIGTVSTRAFLQSSALSTTSIISGAKLWASVDGSASIITTGLNSSVSLTVGVQALKAWGSRIRITAASSVFSNVKTGDWLVAWDANLSSALKGTWRISQASGTYVEIERRSLLTGRWDAHAVVLNDNRVLIIGGRSDNGVVLQTCEIYDPSTNSSSATGSMATGRCQFSAHVLTNGKVLVVGGLNDNGSQATTALIDASVLNTCEIWDPATGLWSAAASLPAGQQRRLAFSAHLTSPSEVVVVAGGIQSSGGSPAYLNTTYKYDPVGNTWTVSGNMSAFYGGSSVTLNASQFLAIGGGNSFNSANTQTQLYDLNLGTWASQTAMNTARSGRGIAVLLSNGKVLTAGGYNASSTPITASEIFDPVGNTWTNTTGTLNTARADHKLTLQGNNDVLASMGAGSGSSTGETFNVGTGLWTTTATSFSADGRRGHQAVKLSSGKVLVISGQSNTTGPGGLASAEIYDYTGNAWSVVDQGLTQTSFTLASNGVAFVRTSAPIQEVDIGAASNYTAASFVSAIGTQISGADVATYHTNSIRINTSTYALGGDIALVATDTEGAKLKIATGNAIENLSTHLASVASGNTQAGTPSFRLPHVLASESATRIVGYTLASEARANDMVVGLKRYEDLYNSATPLHNEGNNLGFISAIQDVTTIQRSQAIDLRSSAHEGLFRGRYYCAAPLALSPVDSLTVVVDQDSATKRFNIPMYRRLTPTASTYGSQNSFKDVDNGNSALNVAFGSSYDFNDFALYMHSRVITDSADATKSTIWRYTRPGPDGDQARLKSVYPLVASAPVAVTVSNTTDKYTDISVVLPSGAAKTGYAIQNATKIGTAAAAGPGGLSILSYVLGYSISNASRDGSNNVTLTLSLPTAGGSVLASITNHGLQIGNSIYVKSTDVNFGSGVKTLTAVTATTVTYVETGAANPGTPNIGTVSFDTAEATLSGASPTIVVGDIIALDTLSGLPAAYKGLAMRITYLANQVVQGYVDATVTPAATPTWSTLGSTGYLRIFPINPTTATASSIATAVTALASAANSTCPVTAKVTGTGTGVISSASLDVALTAGFWNYLSDGVNYVKTTTLAGDYQLTFKNSINANLSTGSDWANEQILLVPQTTKNLVEWLNTLTVTGLSTVADIEASDQSQRLQLASLTAGSSGSIQVQGGSANSGSAAVVGSAQLVTDPDTSTYAVATVAAADAAGFFAGMWMGIQNSVSMQKSVISANTTLLNLTSAGVITIDTTTSTPFWTYSNSGPVLSTTWQVEKQGKYVCYSFNGLYAGASLPSLTGVQEGDWVRIINAATPTANAVAVSTVNQGIYRVVRVEDGTVANSNVRAFWIENPNASDETVEADVAFFTFDSIMPGDQINISTDLWGTANKGLWTVQSVGDVGNTGLLANWFTNSAAGKNTLKLSVATKTSTPVANPGALGATQAQLVQVTEAVPTKLTKRILSIAPNQTSGSYVDIKFKTSPGYKLISAAAGSIMSPLDKLAFSTDLAVGTDGYAHNTGLIAEANRVAYGDVRDPATYPGVVAAGANLNISGPLVKRVTLALSIRTKSTTISDVEDRVRSAVASVINAAGIGDPIAISDIITAAGKVNGVTSVAIISPTFSSGSDLISVQPYEKAMVLDLEADIQISSVTG